MVLVQISKLNFALLFSLFKYKIMSKNCQSAYYKSIIEEMIYLIRHGESHYNIAQKQCLQVHQKHSQQFKQVKFDPAYFDSGLTELGLQQAKKCSKQMADIDIDLVLVTPFRRTLMTCSQIFKQHKNKPKVVVQPFLRQVFQASCDIPCNLSKSMRQLPGFDYSKVKDIDYWYVHTIQHQKHRKSLLENIENVPQSERNLKARQSFLDVLKIAWKQRISEYPINKTVKPKIFKYLSNHKDLIRRYSKEYKNIAIVTHSENIKQYTGKKVKNCQVLSYAIDQFLN